MFGTLTIQGDLEQLSRIAAELHELYPNGVRARVDVEAVDGWSVGAATALLRRLARRQVITLQELVAGDGYVADDALRSRLATEAGADPTSQISLRGLTGPISKHIVHLIGDGLLPASTGNPVTADYDNSNSSYQRTSGLSLARPLVPIFRAAFETIDSRAISTAVAS